MRIASVGTAYPPHRYSQAAISEALTARWQDRMEEPRLINRLFVNSGADFRNLVFPLHVYENLSGFGPTNNASIVTPVELGQKAICNDTPRQKRLPLRHHSNSSTAFDILPPFLIHHGAAHRIHALHNRPLPRRPEGRPRQPPRQSRVFSLRHPSNLR